jgi:hypothetical protein
MREIDRAVADYNEAIRLNPTGATSFAVEEWRN